MMWQEGDMLPNTQKYRSTVPVTVPAARLSPRRPVSAAASARRSTRPVSPARLAEMQADSRRMSPGRVQAHSDENARPQQTRDVYVPPPSPKLGYDDWAALDRVQPGFKGGSRRQRPASAGPRARIQSARKVDDRLETIQRGIEQRHAVTLPPPPPDALTGGDAISVRGKSVPTGQQMLEQLEILRQANAYMRQQQQAAMLRLASATQYNEQLEYATPP